ncbi:MAG: tripartite tricarboxylate transporter substrate binding protein [Betaproteobacteria bacterium]|nr:tripartite tricarboxylate transporter substrate binding protein [Betaproteobacteria bacterium]
MRVSSQCRIVARLLSCGILVSIAAQPVWAQSWPAKPIRMLVPFAPGGTSSVVARTVSAELTKQLGQSVVVENKPGASGITAMQETLAAGSDGYTWVIGHIGSLAVNPYIVPNHPYDVNKDFAAATLLTKVPNIFVIHPDVPVRDMREFIAYAKKNPGKINYGSAGNGSAGHLAFEYLKLVAGIDIAHIPYKGTGPQLVDLLAGRTQASSAGTPALLQHVRAGKLRAIGTGTQKRIASLPDLPTIAEQGFPGFETAQWYGINVPAGVPAEIVRRIAEESRRAVRAPSAAKAFSNDDAEAIGSTPQEYDAFIRAEQKIWSDIVKRARIQTD